mmetsp:Transcript_22842/g.43487  ORF Transcript_22842/g.43487 Transcript_22842/m.43487 type:complete len:428 (-) Transcript_22842:585-1868(-)
MVALTTQLPRSCLVVSNLRVPRRGTLVSRRVLRAYAAANSRDDALAQAQAKAREAMSTGSKTPLSSIATPAEPPSFAKLKDLDASTVRVLMERSHEGQSLANSKPQGQTLGVAPSSAKTSMKQVQASKEAAQSAVRAMMCAPPSRVQVHAPQRAFKDVPSDLSAGVLQTKLDAFRPKSATTRDIGQGLGGEQRELAHNKVPLRMVAQHTTPPGSAAKTKNVDVRQTLKQTRVDESEGSELPEGVVVHSRAARKHNSSNSSTTKNSLAGETRTQAPSDELRSDAQARARACMRTTSPKTHLSPMVSPAESSSFAQYKDMDENQIRILMERAKEKLASQGDEGSGFPEGVEVHSTQRPSGPAPVNHKSVQECKQDAQAAVRAMMAGPTTRVATTPNQRAFADAPQDLSASILQHKMDEVRKDGLEWDVK